MIECPVCQHPNEDFNERCEECGAELFSFHEESLIELENREDDLYAKVDSLVSPTEVLIVFGVNALILFFSLFSSTDSYRSPERIAWLFLGFTIIYSLYHYIKIPEEEKEKLRKNLDNSSADFAVQATVALSSARGGCFTGMLLLILAIIGYLSYEADYFGFTSIPAMGFWEYAFTAYFWIFSIWILIFLPFYIARHFLKQKINSKIYYLVFNLGKLALLYFPIFVILTTLIIAMAEVD